MIETLQGNLAGQPSKTWISSAWRSTTSFVARFKRRVRELTGRHRGVSLERMIGELVPYLRGWAGYFSFSQSRELPIARRLDPTTPALRLVFQAPTSGDEYGRAVTRVAAAFEALWLYVIFSSGPWHSLVRPPAEPFFRPDPRTDLAAAQWRWPRKHGLTPTLLRLGRLF